VVDLIAKSKPLAEASRGWRFIRPATDGKTLVGMFLAPAPTLGGYVAAIDLATGAEQKIADVSDITYPQVSEEYIVWTDNYALNFYDRASGKSGTVNVKGKARNPSLSGITVVWENLPDPSSSVEIWGYDLQSGRDFPVVTDTVAVNPVISGRWVVYMGNGLNAINLDTREKIALGSLDPPNRYLYSLYALDAPWAVWVFGAGDDKPTLHLYNLETRKGITVVLPCSGNSQMYHAEQPVISTPIVIFMGCGQDLGYDFETGSYFSVPIERLQTQAGGFLGWTFAKGQLVWAAIGGRYSEGPAQIYAVSVTDGK
jgi:hypothetical protein